MIRLRKPRGSGDGGVIRDHSVVRDENGEKEWHAVCAIFPIASLDTRTHTYTHTRTHAQTHSPASPSISLLNPPCAAAAMRHVQSAMPDSMALYLLASSTCTLSLRLMARDVVNAECRYKFCTQEKSKTEIGVRRAEGVGCVSAYTRRVRAHLPSHHSHCLHCTLASTLPQTSRCS